MDIVGIDFFDLDKLESKHNVRNHEVVQALRGNPRLFFKERAKHRGEDV